MFTRLKVAVIRRMARKRLGRDIAPLATMATHPGVLVPYAQYGQALDKTNLVSAKLKRLGQIRAAKQIECPF
ncbi:MAG TPA: hypothetical protein VI488_06890 [Candidatus Angelobacter sp.]|jgi:hypothetical protein